MTDFDDPLIGFDAAIPFNGGAAVSGTFSIAVPAPILSFVGTVAPPAPSTTTTPRGFWDPSRAPKPRPEHVPVTPAPKTIEGAFAIRVPAPRLLFVGTYRAPAVQKPKRKYKPRAVHGRLNLRPAPRPLPRFVGAVDNRPPVEDRMLEDLLDALAADGRI